jgi:hypothetical protein
VIPEVSVVYLCWGPLGRRPLEEFESSYRDNPGGCEHRLLIASKDVRDPDTAQACRNLADGLPGTSLLEVSPAPLDLGTYVEIAQRVESRFFCFLNSESRPLDPRWLEKLMLQLSAPGVGLVGASGSYESFSSNAPFVTRPLRRRQFPPFPNPHVRTNAMMISRELMLSLDWRKVTRKLDAWKLESGSQNITRQVWGRGLDAMVVGRDGRAYDRDSYYESNTFRRGDQPNLLVGDKRTMEFETAPPDRRRWLFELAWGAEAVDTSDPDQLWTGPR